jgi:hypothetical protein
MNIFLTVLIAYLASALSAGLMGYYVETTNAMENRQIGINRKEAILVGLIWPAVVVFMAVMLHKKRKALRNEY